MYFFFLFSNIFTFFVQTTDAADTAIIAEKNARTMPLQGMFEDYYTIFFILICILIF